MANPGRPDGDRAGGSCRQRATPPALRSAVAAPETRRQLEARSEPSTTLRHVPKSRRWRTERTFKPMSDYDNPMFGGMRQYSCISLSRLRSGHTSASP